MKRRTALATSSNIQTTTTTTKKRVRESESKRVRESESQRVVVVDDEERGEDSSIDRDRIQSRPFHAQITKAKWKNNHENRHNVKPNLPQLYILL